MLCLWHEGESSRMHSNCALQRFAFSNYSNKKQTRLVSPLSFLSSLKCIMVLLLMMLWHSNTICFTQIINFQPFQRNLMPKLELSGDQLQLPSLKVISNPNSTFLLNITSNHTPSHINIPPPRNTQQNQLHSIHLLNLFPQSLQIHLNLPLKSHLSQPNQHQNNPRSH